MAKYLKKYNNQTGKWEIISPTSSDDICVTNTRFNDEEAPISKLTDVLNDIGSDIDKLKRNVSWLAEHGGGGGVGGGGGSNYKINIMNAGVTNDTLYVNQPKFSVIFKITGGSVNDVVEYRVVYDGNYLVSNFTKTKVNTNISVDIEDIEMFSKVTPHTLVIEAVDGDGMTIPSYTLSIVESSINVTCPASNILTIGGSGVFDVFITNKVLNSNTSIKVINTSYNNQEYNYSYVSTSTAEKVLSIDFYKDLIDETAVSVGNTYNLKIEVQTSTAEGTPINAAPIYTTIMIQGSNKIVINLSSLTTQEAFDADEENGSEFALGGNINFGFTSYLIDNLTTYYAVQLEYVTSSETKTKIDVAGHYDLVNNIYSDNPAVLTGKLKTISWNIPNDERYKGNWLVKIKCWSASGLISNEIIGKCRIIASNTDVFPTQVPIRGNVSLTGNTQYAYWDLTNMPSNEPTSKVCVSEIINYLSPSETDEGASSSVQVPMNVYNTNGEQNGFLSGPTRLRLSSEAYATIKTDIGETWTDKDGFTISLTFKSDNHPYNDRTIFFLGDVDENNEFVNGMKIDLENAYWYFASKSNDGTNTQNKMKVPIRQNTVNTIDFVYYHKRTSSNVEGIAKIFVNGKIYSAVEADYYESRIPETMYLGCAYSSSTGRTFNYADVDISSLRIFSHYLNDMEIVINSHNARASRDENNNIIVEEYEDWKKRNYFKGNSQNIAQSSIYQLVGNSYNYVCPGYVELKGSNPPMPVIWLDGQQSSFTKEMYESTSNDAGITSLLHHNFIMHYYDPAANNGKGKEIEASNVSVSIQGTSTTTLRSKNLEIYFKKELDGYNDSRTQLFQPRDDWFPESQFTLKADVVDSAHANNATLGRWINTEAASSILEDTPPMKAVKNNPPLDAVKDYEGNDVTFTNKQTLPTVKHTLEGFQVILMVTFAGKQAPEMLGIYSFNLGRYSYYNMGLSFFKSFSRRTFNEISNEWEENSAPALINHYDFYERTEKFEDIKLDEVFSFEFGSDADENNKNFNTWSQDDISVLEHIGKFRFNGINGNDETPDVKVWKTLQRVFYATARMPLTSDIYTYNGNTYVNTGERYTADLNVASELMLKRLSIKNTIGYFVIANAFGMVDSLGKNLTLRSWNARYDGSEDDDKDINKWYPCFYDMDTALGLTNAGDESVAPTVYMDKYSNSPINEELIQPNNVIVARNEQQENGFGAYNSKLWNILRSTAENGDPSYFVSSGKYNGELYEATWRLLRKENAPLSNPDLFIDMFTSQTKNCGELLYNLDYNTKYLTKYITQSGQEAYGNIEMLHGDRVEYIRSWLRDRFNYLDGVFEVNNVVDNRLPFYIKGYITCGGPVGGGHPRLTFNTTSPTILKVEIGQNGQYFRYFLPAYKDTEVIMPPLSSDSKRIGINSTTILTKIDGLKDIRFQKFESMSLPKFSQIDLSNINTLSLNNPVQFDSTFVSDNTSDMRDINLYNATGSDAFAVSIGKYDKAKRIDIRNSCVTSIALPSAPLSSLLFSNSEIVQLDITNQPYLDSFDFTGCNKLQKVQISSCDNVEVLNINNLGLLTELVIINCGKIKTINCTNNKMLKSITIEGLPSLTDVNFSDCTNADLSISMKNCNSLTSINLKNIKTNKPVLLPNTVSGVRTLNLENCTNLTGFKYGDNISEVNKYNGEDVLDLRPFTGLSGNNLKLKGCANVKYVKFNNIANSPYALTTSFFYGCSSLKKVFGHVSLNGTGVFSECTEFSILDMPSGTITPMPDIAFKETEDDGNVTNITIATANMSNMFYKTKCHLYDVYYILQKCDNVTNLTSTFSHCSNIKNSNENSLDINMFNKCQKVTTIDALFYATGITGILRTGLLRKCYSLTSFSNYAFGSNTKYIDENFFGLCDNNNPLPIKSITYFNPQIISNSLDDSLVEAYASSSKLLKNLPKLETLHYAFSRSRYHFNDNNYVTYEGKNYYYTDLFYNNPNLTTIETSFNDISATGSIRNLFGGYKATIDDKAHFPQNLRKIGNSFIINESGNGKNVSMYIGDSFLQKIKHSIVYITGSQSGENVATASSSFSGSALTKYIDVEDNEKVLFPYKIFSGCTNLKEVPALFRGLSRLQGQETSDVITLPVYQDEYNNTRSMFDDTKNIQNIAYLFSNMNDIKYQLVGGGFKKCSLINVNRVFAESSSNNLVNGNKEGIIPYGLFLQEQQVAYKNVEGLTEEDANTLGIYDESYGIKDFIGFDNDGKVIVKYDETGNVINGSTYPDGTIIKHNINPHGIIMDGAHGTVPELAPEADYRPLPTAKTSHKGTYKKPNATIQNMGGFMEYSSSKNLKTYRFNVSAEDINYNPTTGVYSCPDLVIDNENYNPIKFFINPDFNPILKIWNDDRKQYVENPAYDPRRVILNKNYDRYKKKWNKWVADGTSYLADSILTSNLYQMIKDGVNTELPLELPVELEANYIPENTPRADDVNNYDNERFNTRSYMCPPDIFRYCKNEESTIITRAFYSCGGPDITREGYPASAFIEYGLYGVIPPYLFEPVNNVTNLSEIFYRTTGILPYRWGHYGNENGLMFAPDLFTGMKKLRTLTGMFGFIHMYNRCKIANTQFSKNTELKEVNNLFYNTIWGSDSSFRQIEDSTFNSNKNITNVSYMFYSSDNIGNNRVPRVMSSNLFSSTINPKIADCSYFMHNAKTTSGSVPEFWTWPQSTMKTITGCYRNINTGVSNYGSIPDSYK